MAAANQQWIPKQKDFQRSKESLLAKPEICHKHPLLPAKLEIASEELKNKDKEKENQGKLQKSAPKLDPLSAMQVLDPLGAVSHAGDDAKHSLGVSSGMTLTKEQFEADEWEVFANWDTKKSSILVKYSTTENVSINVSFLSTSSASGLDKSKSRLEQLEKEEGQAVHYGDEEMTSLSQKDYTMHIEALNTDLARAWNDEERVRALKIVIQSSKLLADTSVIRFYPSKFVLITEILDTFGRLVFDRIKKKAAELPNGEMGPPLPEVFSATKVSEVAKETCRNWFFKIASIRELIPRIYVEMAIIRCYQFLDDKAFPQALNRLCAMIRGVGDPLVALYCRAYLARKGYEVLPMLKDYLSSTMYDFLFTQKQLQTEVFKNYLESAHMTFADYLDLYVPGLDWLVQCIAFKAPNSIFQDVLRQFKEYSDSTLVLNSIMTGFSPQFVADNSVALCKMIKEANASSMPAHKLYGTLGMNLTFCSPPKDAVLGILNEVWKVVSQLADAKEYLSVADIWIEYAMKHCSPKEVNTLLGDVLKHVQPDNAYEKLQEQLQSLVQKVLGGFSDFGDIISMNKFMPLLDLFTGDSRSDIYKRVLDSFCRSNKNIANDPVLINSLFDITRKLHDNLSALSFEDEVKQVSGLITGFVYKVDFGRDVEAQLNFYVECRQSFSNMEKVKYHLVLCVNTLAMKTLKMVKGKHSKKTASFVRACIAYCFITIPSLEEVFPRLHLYLLCGSTALQNQALPQADAFFKAGISLIPEAPVIIELYKQAIITEDWMVSFLCNFASTLVTVPGHPEQGPLYLCNGLISVVRDYPWEKGTDGKLRVYFAIIALYCVYYQQRYPYHIQRIDSNDTLYSGDPAFSEEIIATIAKLLEECLVEIQNLGAAENTVTAKKKQGPRALDMFNLLISTAELTPKSASLAFKLFTLAKNTGFVDQAYLDSTIAAVRALETPLANELLKKMLQ